MEKKVNPALMGAKNVAVQEREKKTNKKLFKQLDRLALLIHCNFTGLD